MVAEPAAADLLREMESIQQHLRDLVGEGDPRYAERPPSGKWSVVENLCHLLLAEQLHLGRYLSNPPPWSRFGLPPTGMQAQARFNGLGAAPASAADLFDAWAVVHEATKALADNDTAQVRVSLVRHVRHLRAHTRAIERQLRASARRS